MTAAMRVEDAAVELGISRASAYRLIAAGRLHPTRTGTGTRRPTLRISRAEIDRFLAAEQL